MTESMMGDDTPTPDYFSEQLALRLPYNVGNQPTYIMPDLPYMDIGTAEGLLDYNTWISSAHPVARLAFEELRNIKSFTGAPVESETKAREPLDLFGVDISDVYTPRVEYAVEGLFPIVSRISSLNKEANQGKTDWERTLRSLGVPLRSVDVDKVMYNRTIGYRAASQSFKAGVDADIKAQMDKRRRLMGLD